MGGGVGIGDPGGGQAGASAVPSCTTPLKRTSYVRSGPVGGGLGVGDPQGGGARGWGTRREGHAGAFLAPSCTTPPRRTSNVSHRA